MSKIMVYPKFVSNIVDEYNNTIVCPRKISKDDYYLKLHHKYISHDFGKLFKVEECFMTTNDVTNYTVRFYNNRYATISLPFKDTIYEIIVDKDQSLMEKEIINEEMYYYGFRIKRWFYNRINDTKYATFIPYIVYDGNNCINDNRLYKIEAYYDKEKEAYGSFKFISMSK